MNVLIAEPDFHLLDTLLEVVHDKLPTDVIGCGDSVACKDLVTNQSFSLIVVDYWIIYEFMEEFFSQIHRHGKETTIVIMTGLTDISHLKSYPAIILAKPFPIEQLENLIDIAHGKNNNKNV